MMLKDSLLEVVWGLKIVFAPLEVAHPVTPSDPVLVGWWFLVARYSYSEYVVTLEAMIKISIKDEL